MNKKIFVWITCVLLFCSLLGGCESGAYEFTHEKTAFIGRELVIFPPFANVSTNQGIAVHGGYYIDMTDSLRVYPLSEATSPNPVAQLEMSIGKYHAAVFQNGHMLLDCKDDPLRYIDLSGVNPPITLNGHRRGEYSAYETAMCVLGENAAFVLYDREIDGTHTYTVEYIDLAANTACDVLTVSGTMKEGTVITEIDEYMGNVMVYGFDNGTWFLREYDKAGVLLGEHTPYPSCSQEEINLLGQVLDMEWIDGYLYVMREDGVQVYTLDADGFYQPVTFAANSAEYVGFSDGYFWFWNHLSRVIYTLNRQTGEFRSFRLDLAGEKIFSATQKDLLFDDSGYILVRCDNDENATKNRLFMFDISAELFK